MKVEIRFYREAGTHTVFKGEVTVIYPRECEITTISQHEEQGEAYISMSFNHPVKCELTHKAEYPQDMLWIKPAYDYSILEG